MGGKLHMPGARDLQPWRRQKGLVMLDPRGLQRQEDRLLLLWGWFKTQSTHLLSPPWLWIPQGFTAH